MWAYISNASGWQLRIWRPYKKKASGLHYYGARERKEMSQMSSGAARNYVGVRNPIMDPALGEMGCSNDYVVAGTGQKIPRTTVGRPMD